MSSGYKVNRLPADIRLWQRGDLVSIGKCRHDTQEVGRWLAPAVVASIIRSCIAGSARRLLRYGGILDDSEPLDAVRAVDLRRFLVDSCQICLHSIH